MAKTAPTIAMRVARTMGSSPFNPVLEFPEKAGPETFVAGDLVEYTSGYLCIQTVSGADDVVCGIAQVGASGTVNTMIPVEVFDQSTHIIANLKNGGADYVLLATDLGAVYGPRRDAAGIWSLDKAETTGPLFRVLGVHPDYAVDDTNAWVYAVPVPGDYFVE